MTGPSGHRADRLLRAVVPVSLLAFVVVALTARAAAPLTNTDTYFHLRFGQEFQSGWSLRDPSSVSSFATADWVPTQWLSQLAFAQMEDWFGLPGVAWLFGALLLALAVTFYLCARRYADAPTAALVVLVGVLACSQGLSMRPQLVSYLLAAVTTTVWLRATATGRAPWVLVPLTWAWAMLHGMWPLGVLIGLATVAGHALDRRHPRADLLRMAAVPALALLAAGLTPVGPALYRAVLAVTSRGTYFGEWSSPDVTHPSSLLLLSLIGTTVVVMLRGGSSAWSDIALLLLAAGLAVYSIRTVPVAAAMAVPLTARALQSLVGPRRATGRSGAVLLAAGTVTALAVLAVLVPRTSTEDPFEPALEERLDVLPPGTPVLDDWGLGGPLMWRFPQLDLVAHGYGDTFTTAELDRNVAIRALEPGWDDLARETGAEVAVLRTGTPLGHALEEAGWRVAERSAGIEVLEAPDGWSAASVDAGRSSDGR